MACSSTAPTCSVAATDPSRGERMSRCRCWPPAATCSSRARCRPKLLAGTSLTSAAARSPGGTGCPPRVRTSLRGVPASSSRPFGAHQRHARCRLRCRPAQAVSPAPWSFYRSGQRNRPGVRPRVRARRRRRRRGRHRRPDGESDGAPGAGAGGRRVAVLPGRGRRRAMDRPCRDGPRAARGSPTCWSNNAGIGISGPFLSTSTTDWEQILGVNVWGVIHGCRLVARQQVERGEGGHIVNIASAAAYSPSRAMPRLRHDQGRCPDAQRVPACGAGPGGHRCDRVCPGFVDTNIPAPPLCRRRRDAPGRAA